MKRVIKTARWDTAESLRTDRDIVGYLKAVLDDGDPDLLQMALGNIARAKGVAGPLGPTGIGVATYEEFKALTLAAMRGEIKLGKPKMWFSSIESAEAFLKQAEADLAELKAGKS